MTDSPPEPVPAAERPDITLLEAAVFQRLIEHLRLREDVSNIDLMATAGFCRNCLADWLSEASIDSARPLTREEARIHIYGEHYADFKARQPEATPEQLARMEASLAENARVRKTPSQRLDAQLDASFPASDPPTITRPR